MRKFSHLPQLDGLRAIAVTIVFLAHCGLENIIPGGFGVTIFFFLSGYLITSLLRSEVAQTGRVGIKDFYIRRTFRIWPPLYITVAFVLLTGFVSESAYKVDWIGIAEQHAFISNYSFLWGHGGRGLLAIPMWSLAIEEHFYLIFPFLYAFWFRKMAPHRVALICALGCVIVLLIRVYCAYTFDSLREIYFLSHTRIDSILFGCCLALWNNPSLDEKVWRPSVKAALSAGMVLLLCLLLRDEFFRQTLRYSLQGGALFVLFLYVLTHDNWSINWLKSAPLRIIGLYSYTFYLVHMSIIAAVSKAWPGLNIPMIIIISGSLAMAYSAVMYWGVERQFALLRKRLHRVDANATLVNLSPALLPPT
jgi:peptidoglycan/LPS O-acetylase OafA/YrhL